MNERVSLKCIHADDHTRLPSQTANTPLAATTAGKWGGATAFVLFTGLSIIPARLTLGDCVTRCAAAVYLRQRSRRFREWVDKVEGAHLLTWLLRAGLLGAATWGTWRETVIGTGGSGGGAGSSMSAGSVMACAAALAGILRLAESHGGSRIDSNDARANDDEAHDDVDVFGGGGGASDGVVEVSYHEDIYRAEKRKQIRKRK